ncbi:MAG: adenylate cyclase, partial [Pseudomonadota bacterium]
MQAYTQKLIQRLDNLNQQRIDRALALMDSQSQQVFHLIPALLNYNHPVIPGYYDADVPYGVFGLELNELQQRFLDDTQLTIGQALKTAEQPAILGLYTMGSTSSIGQSTSSDLDIWVCISPEMDNDQREL